MSGETILKEQDGGVLILTLNRPDEANALNYDLAKDSTKQWLSAQTTKCQECSSWKENILRRW